MVNDNKQAKPHTLEMTSRLAFLFLLAIHVEIFLHNYFFIRLCCTLWLMILLTELREGQKLCKPLSQFFRHKMVYSGLSPCRGWALRRRVMVWACDFIWKLAFKDNHTLIPLGQKPYPLQGGFIMFLYLYSLLHV